MEIQKGVPNLRIKEILVSKGMTAKALAEKMGKAPQYVSNIINGGKGMSVATLTEIAINLDIDFWQLFVSPEEITGDANTITCPHCGGKIHFDGELRLPKHKNIRGKEYYK